VGLVDQNKSLLVTSDVVSHGVTELLVQFDISLGSDLSNLLVEFLLVHFDFLFVHVLELISLDFKLSNRHQVLLTGQFLL